MPQKAPGRAGPTALEDLIGVRPRPDYRHGRPWIRRWCVIVAIVNFASTVPPLVNSVLHHLFDVPAPLLEWAHKDPPTRPFIFWIFLGFGSLWGVFFLYIGTNPVSRRTWMRVAMAEKALAVGAVWLDFIIFDSIGPALPIIVLGTDLLFVFVFGWMLRVTKPLVDRPAEAVAERTPVGSAPVARWLLRTVSVPTIVVATAVVVASLVEVATARSECLELASVDMHSCELLDTTSLWSLPPFVVWLWGGMATILAAAMMWASADVVRRRDIIGFGIAARLIPVVAVVLGSWSDETAWQPTPDFRGLVIAAELVAAFMIWIALRSANGSALALGVDQPATPRELAVPS